MSDLAWIEFVTVWPPVVMQMLCVAFVGLSYQGPLQIVPRWLAYLSLWMALGIAPAAVQFFHTGPFAWNGLISFWVPASCFAVYFCVLVWAMRRAVLQQAEEAEPDASR